ncbi:hypothetical protein [Neorhizobium sp. SOG26]|jgi:hypothetical protein|uniref:hypothetical protein n=1 Tax=Neorhizobium sp. SOG26 TaxID=2060726 RepID=UPI0018FFCC8E|nr:hypothetical protein [Neorhizobium sp. SOG26]
MYDNVVAILLSQHARQAPQPSRPHCEHDFYARHANPLPRWLRALLKRMQKTQKGR